MDNVTLSWDTMCNFLHYLDTNAIIKEEAVDYWCLLYANGGALAFWWLVDEYVDPSVRKERMTILYEQICDLASTANKTRIVARLQSCVDDHYDDFNEHLSTHADPPKHIFCEIDDTSLLKEQLGINNFSEIQPIPNWAENDCSERAQRVYYDFNYGTRAFREVYWPYLFGMALFGNHDGAPFVKEQLIPQLDFQEYQFKEDTPVTIKATYNYTFKMAFPRHEGNTELKITVSERPPVECHDTTLANFQFDANFDGVELHLTNAKDVPSDCFHNCPFLTETRIPHGRTVAANAFTECNQLKRVFIGDAITIDVNAFQNCPELESIVVENKTEVFSSLPTWVEAFATMCYAQKKPKMEVLCNIAANAHAVVQMKITTKFPWNYMFKKPLSITFPGGLVRTPTGHVYLDHALTPDNFVNAKEALPQSSQLTTGNSARKYDPQDLTFFTLWDMIQDKTFPTEGYFILTSSEKRPPRKHNPSAFGGGGYDPLPINSAFTDLC